MAPSSSDNSNRFRELIRDAGLRCTDSRATVLEYLAEASSPQSHANVAEDLVPHGFDQATIYRNLTDLTEAGLLHRLDLGDHVWRFEFRDGDDADDEHPHFVCTDCGDISCLAPVGVTFGDGKTASPGIGEIDEVFLKGRCADCA